MKFNLVLSYVR